MAGIDEYTKLMLRSYGDVGKYSHTVSISDNPTLNGTSKVVGFSSLDLDAAYERFNIPNHVSLRLGSDNFTVELWIRPTGVASYQPVVGLSNHESNRRTWLLALNNADVQFYCSPNGSSNTYVEWTSAVSALTWQHVAVTRIGTTYELFVNGVSKGTRVGSSSIYNNTVDDCIVGALYATFSGYIARFDGALDELRVSNGVRRYTANFTPPAVEFEPDTHTALLLHFDGDASYSAHTMTMNGGLTLSPTVAKLNPSSIGFNGTNAYISSPDNADFEFGSSPFTIDTWVRFSSLGADRPIVGVGTTANDRFLFAWTGNQLKWTVITGGVDRADYYCSWTPTVDTWYHVALVRDGAAVYMFIDGLSQSLTATTSIGTDAVPEITGTFDVGRAYLNSALRYHSGYVDELRVSNGIARWTSDFTPPSEPYSTEPQPTPPSPVPPYYVYHQQANRPKVKNSEGVFIDVGVNYLPQLLDVDISYPAVGDILFYDGDMWSNIRLMSSQDVLIEYDEQSRQLLFRLNTGS